MISVAEATRRGDFLRGPGGNRAAYKEWFHFCVFTPELQLIANLSLMGGVQDPTRTGRIVPRVLLALRDCEGWVGGVEEAHEDDAEWRSGAVGLRIGANSLVWKRDRFCLSIRLTEPSLAVEIEVRPMVHPALTAHLPVGGLAGLSWLLVPRVVADGWVELRGRRHAVRGALGYHDHNWGEFAWGADFGWQWAYTLPRSASEPWSLVFTHVTDRARGMRHTEGMLLWREEKQVRVFRAPETSMRAVADRRPRPEAVLPGAMRLLEEGAAGDVPVRAWFCGRSGDDVLEGEFRRDHFVTIGVPNDAAATGATWLHELVGEMEVRGTIRGESICFTGLANLEVVRVSR